MDTNSKDNAGNDTMLRYVPMINFHDTENRRITGRIIGQRFVGILSSQKLTDIYQEEVGCSCIILGLEIREIVSQILVRVISSIPLFVSLPVSGGMGCFPKGPFILPQARREVRHLKGHLSEIERFQIYFSSVRFLFRVIYDIF